MHIDQLFDHVLKTRFESFEPDVVEAARMRLINTVSRDNAAAELDMLSRLEEVDDVSSLASRLVR